MLQVGLNQPHTSYLQRYNSIERIPDPFLGENAHIDQSTFESTSLHPLPIHMSPIPTPFNPGDLGGKIVSAANTAASAVTSVAPVVTSVAPQATKIAGDAAPVLADVAKNAAGGFDLEKVRNEHSDGDFSECR